MKNDRDQSASRGPGSRKKISVDIGQKVLISNMTLKSTKCNYAL